MNKILQIKDLKNSLKKIKEKKALIITGYRSFNKSGAKKFFKPFFKNKNFYYYYKKFSYPDIKELIDLTKKIKEINPKDWKNKSACFSANFFKFINLFKTRN